MMKQKKLFEKIADNNGPGRKKIQAKKNRMSFPEFEFQVKDEE
jgi:hypothetical protein